LNGKEPQGITKAEMNDLTGTLEDAIHQLMRSLAGVATLDTSINSGNTQHLPLLEMPTSIVGADGVKAMRVVFDLKQLEASHVPHVVIPLLQMQARNALAAIEMIEHVVSKLRVALAQHTIESAPEHKHE
jgi:hypothetical protein